MQTIYYVFEKATGLFAGSGITFFDNETHGSTEVPNPSFDYRIESCVWNGSQWDIVPKSS